MMATNGANGVVMTGAEFVRSRPIEMTVDQVLAEAASLGVVLSRAGVYTQRNQMRKKAEAASTARTEARARRKTGKAGAKKRRAPGETMDELMEFLRSYMASHGKGPTGPVIAKKIGVHPVTANSMVRKLRDTGHLTYENHDFATMRFLDAASTASDPASVVGLLSPSPMVPPISPEEILNQMVRMRDWYQARSDAFQRVIDLMHGAPAK